ncbi:MAG: terpene cyclase/mutase family protein [Kiritimatiellae bacterium]|nr:terpene cyclase/mutase family protein [Kiritimatiellia bacterium]
MTHRIGSNTCSGIGWVPGRPRLASWVLVVALSARLAAGGKVDVAELSPEAEESISRGLRFLASQQRKDGYWGQKHKAGMTSLTLMAFMLKGYFPERGPYGEQLDRGVAFLIQRGKDGAGYFGGNMYEHALSTLALSEVWGMSERDEVRDTLKQAVEVILRAQNHEGGWRYSPQPKDADISVTVMQIVALASAQEAGILVPDRVIRGAVSYVKRCHNPFEGGFSYQPRQQLGFARTAAGVMSLMMCGEGNSMTAQRGLAYLKQLPATKFYKDTWYYYGHYYAIQAMYQAGEQDYQAWYPQIRDALLRSQRQDGSWPASRPEGEDAAIYATSMSILVLGVPYRFLPIYQR